VVHSETCLSESFCFLDFFYDTVVDALSGSGSRTDSPEGGAPSGQIYSASPSPAPPSVSMEKDSREFEEF
jgi:hypothetical protein